MISLPKYDLPIGTEVSFGGKTMSVSGGHEAGYDVVDLATGSSTVITFQSLVDYLHLPGTRIRTPEPPNGSRMQHRLGGYVTSHALPATQQVYGRFHLSICQAMDMLRGRLREDANDNSIQLSMRLMDKPENRKFVQGIAQTLFGEKIYLEVGRGGNSAAWTMYKGRTLMKYFRAFEKVPPGESPLDALVRLDHLKGNVVPRISHRLKELMTKAIEEVGLDTKNPSLANVFRHLTTLVREENVRRKRNDLAELPIPSEATLSAHRNAVVTPMELQVATMGERHARNARGRGSTDIRALIPGELVEIDECKVSLISSAKASGVWSNLSQDARETLKKIDQEIRQRLHILVMIDVATRMPLAWIISDQPRAEATIALFRMATRDKIREKRVYGCDGDPMPAIGIGHIKSDNGPGLRNPTAVAAGMGMGWMNTFVRVYSSPDKPYVERMFGTTESVLMKIIHGYTGRKPGDLPGYDATANGVLDIEELYGVLTRFMIDEYPSMRHSGVGMGMRRPVEVFNHINETRGCFAAMDPNLRRIHLGWEVQATPTDEGVRVFGGIWFASDELHKLRENPRVMGKVSVFVDPENLSCATVLIPGVKEPVEVQIQITAFADMTVPEVLELIALWRKEDPKATSAHEDQLMRLRRARFDQLRAIGVERKLTRSYSTLEECQQKAKHVLAGARIIPNTPLAGTTMPGRITDTTDSGAVIFQIGDDDMLIDGEIFEPPFEDLEIPTIKDDGGKPIGAAEDLQHGEPSGRLMDTRPPIKRKAEEIKALGRPRYVKGLE